MRSISSRTGLRSPSRFFSASWKTRRSASSSSSSSSPVSWLASSWISRPTSASRRRIAWSLTICAYSAAFEASGTTWSSPIRYAGPPTAASWPRVFSSSERVRWSTVRCVPSSPSIAAKICACAALEKSSAWTTSARFAITVLSASTEPEHRALGGEVLVLHSSVLLDRLRKSVHRPPFSRKCQKKRAAKLLAALFERCLTAACSGLADDLDLDLRRHVAVQPDLDVVRRPPS